MTDVYADLRGAYAGSSLRGSAYRSVPPGADLSDYLSPPGNQNHQDCVGFAAVSLMEAVRRRDGNAPRTFSVSYIYEMCQSRISQRRGEAHIMDHDTASLSDAAEVLLDNGCPPASMWTYDRYMQNPSSAVNDFARLYRLLDVLWLDRDRVGDDYDLSAMRDALDHGNPFAVMLVIYDFKLNNGRLVTPTQETILHTKPLFGHAAICYGYTGEDFLMFNTSYGEGFGVRDSKGVGGKFVVGGSYLGNPLLAFNHCIYTAFKG